MLVLISYFLQFERIIQDQIALIRLIPGSILRKMLTHRSISRRLALALGQARTATGAGD